jgi:hypothetical protein
MTHSPNESDSNLDEQRVEAFVRELRTIDPTQFIIILNSVYDSDPRASARVQGLRADNLSKFFNADGTVEMELVAAVELIDRAATGIPPAEG